MECFGLFLFDTWSLPLSKLSSLDPNHELSPFVVEFTLEGRNICHLKDAKCPRCIPRFDYHVLLYVHVARNHLFVVLVQVKHEGIITSDPTLRHPNVKHYLLQLLVIRLIKSGPSPLVNVIFQNVRLLDGGGLIPNIEVLCYSLNFIFLPASVRLGYYFLPSRTSFWNSSSTSTSRRDNPHFLELLLQSMYVINE